MKGLSRAIDRTLKASQALERPLKALEMPSEKLLVKDPWEAFRKPFKGLLRAKGHSKAVEGFKGLLKAF